MVGILSSCIPAIIPAPLHYHSLQADKNKTVAQGGYNQQISLSQWESYKDTPFRSNHLYRRFSPRLGSHEPGSTHRGSMDSSRARYAYQLFGAPGSMECGTSILPNEGKYNSANMAGQLQCISLYQPYGGTRSSMLASIAIKF